MDEEDIVPLCTTCNHRHAQGIRCPICGHIGKSQIYPKMKMRAALKRAFHFEFFECSDGHMNPSSSSSQTLNVEGNGLAMLRIVQYIRKLCVSYPPHDNGSLTLAPSSFSEKSYEETDTFCRHAIGFLGDAPAVIGRWRLIELSTAPPGSSRLLSAEVESIAVLPNYRGRSFGRACWSAILGDIAAVNAARGGNFIYSVQVSHAAGHSGLDVKLQAEGFALSSSASGTIAIYSRFL